MFSALEANLENSSGGDPLKSPIFGCSTYYVFLCKFVMRHEEFHSLNSLGFRSFSIFHYRQSILKLFLKFKVSFRVLLNSPLSQLTLR